MRSFLFIPGDSPKKLEKGLGSGADALLLDLEDSISPQKQGAGARHHAGLPQGGRSGQTAPRASMCAINGFAGPG